MRNSALPVPVPRASLLARLQVAVESGALSVTRVLALSPIGGPTRSDLYELTLFPEPKLAP